MQAHQLIASCTNSGLGNEEHVYKILKLHNNVAISPPIESNLQLEVLHIHQLKVICININSDLGTYRTC